jgi:hypothetical protein
MAKDFIDVVSLEPYSNERVIVVKGFTYEEVVDWFKDLFSTTDHKNLSKIKEHFTWYNDHLYMFEKVKKDIESSLTKETTVVGRYESSELPNVPGCKFRMIILKHDWDPKNPYNIVTLAHEVLHLCQEYLPIFLDRDEEHEAEAYFHTHIMTSIIKRTE